MLMIFNVKRISSKVHLRSFEVGYLCFAKFFCCGKVLFDDESDKVKIEKIVNVYKFLSIKWYQSYSDLSSGIRAIQIYQFEPIRADEVLRMVRKLYRSSLKEATEARENLCRSQIRHCTEVVQVKPFLADLTLNAMMRMISGKRYYYGADDVLTVEEKEKADRFQALVAEISEVMGATNIGDYLPVLRWFGVSKLEKRLICLQAKRDLFMQELVEELKGGLNKSAEEKKRKNLIEMLLSLQKTEPECYTDEMIRSIMLNMHVANLLSCTKLNIIGFNASPNRRYGTRSGHGCVADGTQRVPKTHRLPNTSIVDGLI
ncbi:hypothetical protein OSB04_005187 [Centaurea solstitialis]|uniref:Cytochrome P450 n=1 Tax=Centaurea solstitialis TaxID=347529 RepID=A0AA38WGJ4_9ASTR|nr:hypothetical protein OSB04_005187 [Centaurea solstitialis]